MKDELLRDECARIRTVLMTAATEAANYYSPAEACSMVLSVNGVGRSGGNKQERFYHSEAIVARSTPRPYRRAHSQTHVLGSYESFEALSPIIKAYKPIMATASQQPGSWRARSRSGGGGDAAATVAAAAPAIKEVLYPSHRAASDFFLPRHVMPSRQPSCSAPRRVYTRSFTTPEHHPPPTRPPRRVTFDLPYAGAAPGDDVELEAAAAPSGCSTAGMTSVCEVAGVASWLRSRRQANNKEAFRVKTSVSSVSLTRRYSGSSVAGVLPPSPVQSVPVRRGGAAIDANRLPPTVGPAVGPTCSSTASQALLRACRDGDEDALSELLTSRAPLLQPADVNCCDSTGRTPASYAAASGSLAIVEALARLPGVDFNRSDNEGNTPLHFVAQAGHVEVLNLLLSRCAGVEVDARNNLGFTPLMKAALQGRTKCAKLLLFAGASPSLRDLGRGFRAEQWARYCGRHVCAEVIDKFSRHRLLERAAAAHGNSGRWGSEPELCGPQATPVAVPPPQQQQPQHSGGGSWLRSKLRRAFRSNTDAPSGRSKEYSSSLPSSHAGTPPPQTPRVFIVPKVQVTPAGDSPTTAPAADSQESRPAPNSRRKK